MSDALFSNYFEDLLLLSQNADAHFTVARLQGGSYLVDPFGELCSHVYRDESVDVRVRRDHVTVVDKLQSSQYSTIALYALDRRTPCRQ